VAGLDADSKIGEPLFFIMSASCPFELSSRPFCPLSLLIEKIID
jgi:hypothetical protein